MWNTTSHKWEYFINGKSAMKTLFNWDKQNNLWIASGKLLTTPDSIKGYWTYTSNELIKPSCTLSGTFIWPYGLEDIP